MQNEQKDMQGELRVVIHKDLWLPRTIEQGNRMTIRAAG